MGEYKSDFNVLGNVWKILNRKYKIFIQTKNLGRGMRSKLFGLKGLPKK